MSFNSQDTFQPFYSPLYRSRQRVWRAFKTFLSLLRSLTLTSYSFSHKYVYTLRHAERIQRIIDFTVMTFVPLGLPVSWIMMAPSISPSTPGGPNNPGLRLYKFETATGQVSKNDLRHVTFVVSDRTISIYAIFRSQEM